MKKILAIGNSFSEDATYYLHQIGEAAGVENQVVNLYIGGCPLERHWKNIEENCRDYMFQINGVKTDRNVSINDMMKETSWDAIVTHQASHDSGWENTYEPFLPLLLDYLHENAPGATIYFNETWAYEKDSTHGCFMRYNRDQQEMYNRVCSAYHAMADKYRLPLIPSGELIQQLRESKYFSGTRSICRDGFHMNYLYGRYALAAMWASAIMDVRMTDNTYVPSTDYMPLEPVDMEVIEYIRRMVDDINR